MRTKLQFTVRSLLVACIAVAICFGIGRTAYRAVSRACRPYTVSGPTSTAGYTVVIDVHDNDVLGLTSSFLTDVYVYDMSGREVASWFDHYGQERPSGVRRFIQGMYWEHDHTLVFYSRAGRSAAMPPEKVSVTVLPDTNTPVTRTRQTKGERE